MELKEFSILYLVINNIELFEKNIELLADLNLYSPICKDFLNKIVDFLTDNNEDKKNFNESDFIKNEFSDLIKKIKLLAPIKFILKSKNDEEKLLKIFNEIVLDIEKFDNLQKIEFLEKKLIEDMNEETFKELLELKKQVN